MAAAIRLQNGLILKNICKDFCGIQYQVVRNKSSLKKDPTRELKDVCRLPYHLRRRMKHRPEFVPNIKNLDTSFIPDKHKIKGFRRGLFGKYGFKSGIKPSEIWPSEREVQAYDSEDRHWFEPPLKEMISTHKEEIQMKEKAISEKMKRVEKNMELMPGLIEKFRLKQKKASDDRDISKKKVLEDAQEAREHFGFDIAKHDPRFKKWMEEKKLKKKEERKQKKRDAQFLLPNKNL